MEKTGIGSIKATKLDSSLIQEIFEYANANKYEYAQLIERALINTGSTYQQLKEDSENQNVNLGISTSFKILEEMQTGSPQSVDYLFEQSNTLDYFNQNCAFYNTLNTPSSELVFSPDGSKIYDVEHDFFDDYSSVYQYDLSQTNLLNSKTLISNQSGQYRLWLAPNHKIYLFQFFSECFDGEISCPNQTGTSCGYSTQQTCLGGGNTGIYCTNIMAHLLYDSEGCFVGIEELNENKELIKIIDATGREVKSRPKMLLFYNFTDGTVKKVFLLE